MCRIANTLSRDEILKNVYCQLVNKDKNLSRLAKEPYKDFLDLAVQYKIIVKEHENCISSFEMDNILCAGYGMGLEELDAVARRNSREKGFRMWQIGEMLTELVQSQRKDIWKEKFQNVQMWIFTNEKMLDGAGVMLFPEYFSELAQKLEDDLFILPSSIYEVIAVPVAQRSANVLRNIVCHMNTYLEDSVILSENVYRYSLEEGTLIIE